MAWDEIPVGRGKFKKVRKIRLKNPKSHAEMFELLLSFLVTEVFRDKVVDDDFMDKKFSMRDLRYAYLRLKGTSKAEAYRGAGYAPTKNYRQIEAKETNPVVREIMLTVLSKGMVDANLPPQELVRRIMETIDQIEDPIDKKNALMELAVQAGYGIRPLEIIADVEKHAGGMEEILRKMMAVPENNAAALVNNVGYETDQLQGATGDAGSEPESWPESGGVGVARSTKQRGAHISDAIVDLALENRETVERSRVPKPPASDDERQGVEGGAGESA